MPPELAPSPAADAGLDRLALMHAEVERALAGLPLEALDWTPGPGFNSLAALVVHTAGAEHYWLGDVAAGRPSDRDRDAEFRAAGLSAGQLQNRMAAALACAREVIGQLSDAQLGETRVVPRDGRPVTVAWCLAHALEHTALHTGQIQLMRQMWDQRAAGARAAV
jgi:uncharacterized damage-inducible protein DinB